MKQTLLLRSAAAVALIGLPLAGAPAWSQTEPTQQQSEPQQSQAPAGGDAATQGGAPAGQEDALVAKVGDREIRGSDVMTVIGMLPEPLRAQPPELLVPMAVDQLILRELILEKARAANLQEDPEVAELAKQSAQASEDDAMVQVWVERELESRVTDDALQGVYDTLKASGQEVPPMEQIRPQLEQQVRQQALGEIRNELQEGAEIVFYDPSGQPVDAQQMGGQPTGGQSSGTDSQSTDSQSTDSQSTGGASSTGGSSSDSSSTTGDSSSTTGGDNATSSGEAAQDAPKN